MTPEQISAFLAEPRNAVVAAIRRDGRPQMTPNWFYWDGERFYISTTKTRQKYHNFRRDPRVQLLIDDATGHRSVLVDGTVAIREDVEAVLPLFKQISIKHRGSAPDDETMLNRLRNERRVLLVIAPDRPLAEWTAWS